MFINYSLASLITIMLTLPLAKSAYTFLFLIELKLVEEKPLRFRGTLSLFCITCPFNTQSYLLQVLNPQMDINFFPFYVTIILQLFDIVINHCDVLSPMCEGCSFYNFGLVNRVPANYICESFKRQFFQIIMYCVILCILCVMQFIHILDLSSHRVQTSICLFCLITILVSFLWINDTSSCEVLLGL